MSLLQCVMKLDSVCLPGTLPGLTICYLIGSGESGVVTGVARVMVEKVSGDEHT